jgi:amino acid transporter
MKPPALSFWRALQAVAWSFLGIRQRAEGAQDMAQVRPLHFIAIGLLGVFALIGLLMVMVHWVVSPP